MTAPLPPEHDRWDELAAGHALDALEPAEETEFLAHLDRCPICQAALQDHQLIAAQLGALADDADVAPPPWSSIRAGVIGGEPVSAAAEVAVLADYRTRRRPVLLGAAAAAVLLVVGVVTAVQIGGSSAREQAVSACQSAPGCHVIELQRGSRERAVVLVRDGAVRVLSTHLSALGADKVYALWQLPRDGKPTLLAEPVQAADKTSAPLALPYDHTAAFALSVEPEGRPATTPTNVVAVGTATT